MEQKRQHKRKYYIVLHSDNVCNEVNNSRSNSSNETEDDQLEYHFSTDGHEQMQ